MLGCGANCMARSNDLWPLVQAAVLYKRCQSHPAPVLLWMRFFEVCALWWQRGQVSWWLFLGPKGQTLFPVSFVLIRFQAQCWWLLPAHLWCPCRCWVLRGQQGRAVGSLCCSKIPPMPHNRAVRPPHLPFANLERVLQQPQQLSHSCVTFPALLHGLCQPGHPARFKLPLVLLLLFRAALPPAWPHWGCLELFRACHWPAPCFQVIHHCFPAAQPRLLPMPP